MEWWHILLIVLGSVLLLFLLTIVLYKPFFKRFWDIVLSFFAILILSPIFLVLSILVLIFMGHPILFGQERIGKKEKIFKLYKFRSMTNAKDENGKLLDESKRLTKFGLFLRSSSLDELPELFAILFGKMSFVGPRPQPRYYGPYYTEEERIAHKVRGGLLPPDSLLKTQQCSWEEQLRIEKEYAEKVSVFLDIKIVFCTFIILIQRVKHNYGADDRPKLSEYRKDWPISREEKEKWGIVD